MSANTVLAAGCGGISKLPDAGGGTPGGRYTLHVTVTPGSAAQAVTLQLNVNWT